MLNTSTISFSNLDNENSFTEPFPNFSEYNTSFVNVSIDNIYAPNKKIVFEDDGVYPLDIYSAIYAANFTVKGNGWLDNISVYLENGIDTNNGSVTVQLYTAKWDSVNGRHEPDSQYGSDLITDEQIYNFTGWYNFTNLNTELKVSQTLDNVFFVVLQETGGDNTFWYFDYDHTAFPSQDFSDDLVCYRKTGPSSWLYITQTWGASSYPIDFNLKCGFKPLNNTPAPTEINLKIEDTIVKNITRGSGYWNPSKSYNSTTDEIEFEITSDWYDVSCDITEVQINYTKTDLFATSEFNILGGGQEVLWNITRNGGLNYFDSRLNNYTINFTIPSTWNDVEVWNSGTNKTDNIYIDPLGNGYDEVQVFNAGNGTFWFLNATSDNLLQSIDIYDINSNPITAANYSDKIHINATFSTKLNSAIVSDQGVNLSVYSPIAINNLLNYTKINTTFNKEKIELGNWTIKNNVTQYGDFRVQVWWNNGTAAGFNETILTIYGETELQPTLPDDIFDASDTFDLIVYFNDTKQNLPIIGADINYSINGGSWRYDNIVDENNGNYTINIDCNDTDFGDSGLFSIMINASKHYYNNDTETVEITIIGETDLKLSKFPDKLSYNSSEIFNITAYFNNTVRNKGIDGASIDVEIDGVSYTPLLLPDNYAQGYYNITIECNAIGFDVYGSRPIVVIINLTHYYNQSETIYAYVIGETELTADRYPNIAFYNSTKTFNITAYFNDTPRSQGINGATISVKIKGTAYPNALIHPFGQGYYNITIECNTFQFGDYGPATITVNASKIHFDNDSINIPVNVRGNSALQVTKAPASSYSSKDIFNITVYFNDTARNDPITNADLTIEVNETIYDTYWEDLLNGFYNITINCSDSIFADKGYGDFIVRINSSKIYFYNKSTEVSFNVGAETDLTYSLFPDRSFFDSNELFNITVFYNDTAQNEGIDGATIIVEINGDVYDDFSPDNYAKGLYNITINCSAEQFNDYGQATITVNASKISYDDQQISISPNIQITGITELTISRYPIEAYYSSSKFINITAYFNDTSRNRGINEAIIQVKINGIIYTQHTLGPYGLGFSNITINLNNNFFETNGYGLFDISINASKINYYEDIKIISIFVVGNTALAPISPAENSVIVSGTGIFVITVNYTDVELTSEVDSATITYSINGQSYRSDNWVQNADNTYSISIDIDDPNFGTLYGFIDIIINASKYKYFNRSITFTIHRQIQTSIDSGTSENLGSIYRSENSSYSFNYTEYISDNPISGATVSLTSSDEGFTWLLILGADGNYTIKLDSTGVFAREGEYTLLFRVNATGNQTQFITIHIIVLLPKTAILSPTTNIVGGVVPEGFNLTLNFNFTDAFKNIGITTITTENVTVMLGTVIWWDVVNDPNFANNGWRLIRISLDGNYTLNIGTYGLTKGNLYVIIINITYFSLNPGPYNYSLITIEFYYVFAPAAPSDGGDGGDGGRTTVTGIAFEELIFYIIIISAVVGIAAAIVGVQKGVIAPKKREKERILREVTTIFDDAINLEHILVIYKGTGTCVFFKSYGMEEIEPDLISGFLSAVSSFGKEMDSQEALNQIQYGDKTLLLADGQFIRVALVLDKEASIILRQHLKEFVDKFEKKYASALPDWRGQLAPFRDAGPIVDNIFHTSIILPHEVVYDITKVKVLKNPHSKDVLRIANTLIATSKRKFFFIATLLVEATDKTGKDKAEVFMGIKELRDNNILIPIEISAIEKPSITQQELNLIRQQLKDLPNLSEEEIQQLVNNLAQMNPAEREAYLASRKKQAEIITAPIRSKAGIIVIDNVKSAKREVNKLKKLARSAMKRKSIEKSIEIYQNAAVIATNWDLTKEFEELEDTIRIIRIEDLRGKMKVLESEAKVAAKGDDYAEAAQKYRLASQAASEIFKLGITEMTKEVKRLTNKSKEFEKLT